MRQILLLTVLTLSAAVGLISAADPEWVYKVTKPLPNVSVKMKTPGFWIGMHPYPDKIIMSSAQIDKWNRMLIEQKLVKSIPELPQSDAGEKLVKTLMWTWNDLTNRGPFVNSKLKKLDLAYFNSMKDKMNIAAIPATNTLKYGIIVRYAPQRNLPTVEPLYDSPAKTNFDRNLVNHLDIGTPVAVKHATADGKWLYTVAPLTEGWIETGAVAFCGLQDIKDFEGYPVFAVTTAVRTDLYLDPSMTKFYTVLRIGVKLPVSKKQPGGSLKIVLPFRGDDGKIKWGVGYVKPSDVSRGYLGYTPRNIYELAFRLLYTPYGWMGSMGFYDCSDFLRAVFACTGVVLPRYSYYQISTGDDTKFPKDLSEKDRLALVVKKGVGGITLIRTTGHILLYIGSVGNIPYVIHDTWGYVDKDKKYWQIAGVTISDLSLNQYSTNGSLAMQMEAMTVIRLP
ncbi:MAG: hypothetical protein HPY53_04010 [Brevinematales bacterium]|nr:hypothetical protein [Brevinematales bacterium]